VVIEDFGFVEKRVSDFGLAEVFLGIFDLGVGFLDELIESLLDLHGVIILNFF